MCLIQFEKNFVSFVIIFTNAREASHSSVKISFHILIVNTLAKIIK